VRTNECMVSGISKILALK